MKDLLVKTVFESHFLKLSLPTFLKCFLIFAYFQPHFSYRQVSYKKPCRLAKNLGNSRTILQRNLEKLNGELFFQ